MGYKVIDNYAEARRLYDEGLLYYGISSPTGGYTDYTYPIPKWWSPLAGRFEFESMCKYAIYLEE